MSDSDESQIDYEAERAKVKCLEDSREGSEAGLDVSAKCVPQRDKSLEKPLGIIREKPLEKAKVTISKKETEVNMEIKTEDKPMDALSDVSSESGQSVDSLEEHKDELHTIKTRRDKQRLTSRWPT